MVTTLSFYSTNSEEFFVTQNETARVDSVPNRAFTE